MADDTTRLRLEKQLSDRRESIDRRIDQLEDEIVSVPAELGKALTRNPLVGIAGAVIAGMAVGLLFSGRKKRRSNVAPLRHRLVNQYIDAVGEDVRRMVKHGANPVTAVRDSLRQRAPIVLDGPDSEEEERTSKGFLRDKSGIVAKAALLFAIRSAVNFAVSRLTVGDVRNSVSVEDDESTSTGSHGPEGDGTDAAALNPTELGKRRGGA